jgi:hypothetical protein
MRNSKSIDGVSGVIDVIGDATRAKKGASTMNVILRWVGVLALLVAPIAANAQTVTYAFTGVVTSSTDAGRPVGKYVTGTYTFNYNAADRIIGILPGPPTIGSWAIGSTGVPYNPVFSSTVRVDGFTYSSNGTAPPSDPDDSSVVTGNGFSTLSASEATPAFDMGSFFTIVENNGNLHGPYSDTGHPVTLTASRSGFGGFAFGDVLLRYEITSLTLAPAPAPTALLATLLTDVTGVERGDALVDLVERAQIEYAASDIPATCHLLAKVLQEVQGKDGKNGNKIPSPLDVTLTRQAQAIAAWIDCT